MDIYVNGSLAYDRLMKFKGRFCEQFLPDQLHNINVSFTTDNMREFFGGTAGNIAYGLALLKARPTILGNLGKDGGRYLEYLRALEVDTAAISLLPDEFTAGAVITTDLDNNQITSFNAGAMKYPSKWQPLNMEGGVVIIAPGNLEDMRSLPQALRAKNIPFIFDPGQSLPAWQAADMGQALRGAQVLIFNEYEMELSCRMLKTDLSGLLKQVKSLIVTKGKNGSLVYHQGRCWQVGAAPLAGEALDPTGAGDAYRAGMLKGLADGLDLLAACVQGSALAGLKVLCQGTQNYQIPPQGLNTQAVKVSELAG